MAGNNVRLTEQAHQLLSEKSVDYNASMKKIASEAILMLHKREDKDRELRAAHANVIQLEEKIRDNKLFAFGTFLLGALIGACLMFVIGVTI